MNFQTYTDKSIAEVFDVLKTCGTGLTEKEALVRLEQYGFNEIPSNHHNVLAIFTRQITSPFFYLIIAAAIIAFLVGEPIDALVIAVTALINIAIGFFQEYRAEKTVSLLRKIIPETVKVLRNGELKTIGKKFLVVGDMVLLESGDMVPADIRVCQLHNFLIDESALTGESISVAKFVGPAKASVKEVFMAQNIIFTGTFVVSGKANGIVVATGKSTAFGHIANLVSGARRQSAYEKNIISFCRLVLRIVLTTIILIFIANLLLKGFGDFFNLMLFSIALIVSILPEALPAVVTFSLSRGSMQMAKNHVVVKRLAAIEDLGNIEILCSDKTGTLTENSLSLDKIVSSNKEKALLYALLGLQKENQEIQNPFDRAFFTRAGRDSLQAAKKFKVISEVPFDSVRMCASVLVEHTTAKGNIMVTKGAPELVLKHCQPITGSFNKQEILADIEREGLEGKRTLAIAFKKFEGRKVSQADEKGLTFLGYFVFEDPLKKTAFEAIRLSKKLGVKIKIITGDSKEVAGFIAKKVRLITDSKQVVSGQDLEKMLAGDFDEACQSYDVFARISPETKYNIIRSLQKTKEVGFLGEGINDAPALKISNVGIAVPSASDISREVADIVMLKKDLRVIVEGIKHGRVIFANINKYIKCTMIGNFGNFYSVATVSLFVNFLPMLPVQILLGNLLSDFPLITIATDTVDVEELKKPKMYQLHHILPLIVALALVSSLFDFIFFFIFYKQSPASIQTLWFIMSILTELALIFIIRTRRVFWKTKRPNFSLWFLILVDAVFITILPFLWFGKSLFHFVSPSILSIIIILVLVAFYAASSEIVKLIYSHYFKIPQRG